jgi:SAM-dependent methyltransferase
MVESTTPDYTVPMDDLKLLLDLHRPQARLGPGSDADTLRALALTGLEDRAGLRIADLGCGTGASALLLAERLNADIVAVDLFPAFLAELERRATLRPLRARLQTLAASMDDLPFEAGSLDAIWSEGAIYNLGFAAGIRALRPLLTAGGVLAVSELTWLGATRPAALQAHWDAEYPEVDRASAKLAVLEAEGFTPVGYFPLPPSSWLQGYYRPLQARFPAFLDAHGHSAAARELVAAEEREIALYEAHQEHVSYGFYVARRTGG